jgi:hypothetical protein
MDHRTHAVSRAGPRPRRPSGPGSGPARQPSRTGLTLGVIASLEVLWLAWYLWAPLPNFSNLGVPVRRGLLLLKAFPEVVPDTPFHESLLGKGLLELSHVENLPQRVPIVLAAGLIAAAAIGLGDLAARGLRLHESSALGERIALDYGLGAALLGASTLLLGRWGWLGTGSIRVALGSVALLGLVQAGPWRLRLPGAAGPPAPPSPTAAGPEGSERAGTLGFGSDRLAWLSGLAIAPFVIIMILGSMLPTIDFDVLEYHLQGPKEYFQAGRIRFLPHNVYTNMPFDVEMLHLLGMEVLGDWWWGGLAGQLLVALFAPAAAVLIGTTAGRASPRAGGIAALVFLSTPWTYRLAVIAYVEGPLCFYHAALIWAFVRGRSSGGTPGMRTWGLLGLLAGGAMGCKYPALISAVIPFGILALIDAFRRRRPGPLVAYALGWAVVMGPWLVKNVIDTGDPVYPLGYRVFHGRHWDEAMEAKWRAGHGPGPVTEADLGSSVVDVAGRSDWQSPLYLALAPLALLRPGSRRMALALWGYVAYLFLTWWLLTHRVDRFWLPLLSPLAMLAGLGGDWIRHRAWSILLGSLLAIGLLITFTYDTTALAGLNEWTADLEFLRHDIPLRWNRSLATMDADLPPEARVLLVGQAAVFHLDHRVVYNTVFNREILETMASGQDPEGFHRALRERGLTHIYVDWKEIQRHRQLGGYGFTAFVTRERFAGWVAAGVLERLDWPKHRPKRVDPEQELYRVR